MSATVTAKEAHERPILFSGPMVRAILEGCKTQTRRVLRVQPEPSDSEKPIREAMCEPGWFTNMSLINGDVPPERMEGDFPHEEYGHRWWSCPYGKPGDRLWVRETFAPLIGGPQEPWNPTMYRADNLPEYERLTWKPSIFMPRWASRITLEITDVRVERLQEISAGDAIAEGLDQNLCAEVFGRAAGKVERSNSYWLEHEETSEEDSGENGNYCRACALKRQKRLGKKWRLMGDGGSAMESDGPAFCDCGTPVLLSLSEYVIERELRIEDDPDGKKPERFPVSGMDARIAEMIADGIGDLQDGHLGRLAQIGFATGWNALNAKRGYSWESNPWVWVICFRRVALEAR